MAEQLFETSGGISLGRALDIIYGTGAPGTTDETNNAPVGSSYHNISDGAKWQKIANINSVSGWIELAGKEAAIAVEHISSTGVVLDQVPATLANEFAWSVTVINENDLTNKYSCLIHMSHNGTKTTDATNVTFDQSSILRQGAKIAGLQITGTLSGTGENQFMNLHVSSQTMVTFIAYRMIKNVAGSKSLVLGGGNLDNHIADGSVHLQPWQNTLLDGVNQSLTSTNLNSLLNISGNVQLQLDAKANSSDVTTALSGKADSATVNTALASKQDVLGFTPYNVTNPNGYQTSAQVLSAIASNAYSLPTASTSVLGGVKVDGTTVTINGSGIISAAASNPTSTATITTWTGTPYDLIGATFGTNANSEVVYRIKAPRAITIPANFAGATATAGTAAAGSTTYSIQRNGSQVGTVTFGAGSTTGTYSNQSAIAIAAGDIVKIVAPATADANLADIDFAILSTLT